MGKNLFNFQSLNYYDISHLALNNCDNCGIAKFSHLLEFPSTNREQGNNVIFISKAIDAAS